MGKLKTSNVRRVARKGDNVNVIRTNKKQSNAHFTDDNARPNFQDTHSASVPLDIENTPPKGHA